MAEKMAWSTLPFRPTVNFDDRSQQIAWWDYTNRIFQRLWVRDTDAPDEVLDGFTETDFCDSACNPGEDGGLTDMPEEIRAMNCRPSVTRALRYYTKEFGECRKKAFYLINHHPAFRGRYILATEDEECIVNTRHPLAELAETKPNPVCRGWLRPYHDVMERYDRMWGDTPTLERFTHPGFSEFACSAGCDGGLKTMPEELREADARPEHISARGEVGGSPCVGKAYFLIAHHPACQGKEPNTPTPA